ncbi:MAG: electron transport complex subunit RsxE, partial [Spirochaetales bacterium]
MSYYRVFAKGIWEKNPILILGIGMCPTLAVSTSVSNALWMTLAATFVLIFSNIFVS